MPGMMHDDKRGITATVLVLLVISFILAVTFIGACSSFADILIGGSDAQPRFSDFLEEINSLSDGEAKEVLISLDEDMALVGFSRDAEEFRCIGCDQKVRQAKQDYFLRKPIGSQCEGKSCACLCEGIRTEGDGSSPTPLTCDRLYCQELNADVASSIDPTQSATDGVSWENGFFFARSDDVLDGTSATPNSVRTASPFIEAASSQGRFIVAACPELPCLGE